MEPTSEPRVIIRHCGGYDVERIREIVRGGLEALGVRPRGRIILKPNLVSAGPLFPHAHTRAEFGEGVLRALQDVGGAAITELAVGERCGITIPTRSVFAQSGFAAMVKRVPGALDRDLELSRARKRLDWEAQQRLSIDPSKFEAVRRKRKSKTRACSMCGDFCAMRIVSEFLHSDGEADAACS